MVNKSVIDDFIKHKNLAIVGLSRSGKKFSNMAAKELQAKGYQLFPVNPHAAEIDGQKCYPNLQALAGMVDGALVMVPPKEATALINDAAEAGITRIWLQQGAESQEAIDWCAQKGIALVHGECILMFAEPVKSFHRFHRWIWKLIGKLPQ